MNGWASHGAPFRGLYAEPLPFWEAPGERKDDKDTFGGAYGFMITAVDATLTAASIDKERRASVAGALERGIHSGGALKPAGAEMDVQGDSTLKVAAIIEKLCGYEGSRRARSARRLPRWMDRGRHGGSVPWNECRTAIAFGSCGRRRAKESPRPPGRGPNNHAQMMVVEYVGILRHGNCERNRTFGGHAFPLDFDSRCRGWYA